MALLNYFVRWLAGKTYVLFLLSFSLTTQNAGADDNDTFNVTIGSTLMYDSNVFRLSPLINPVTFLGRPERSDQIVTTTATLNINKSYSLQRFEFNGSIVDNRYSNFNFLNFIGKNYSAAWHWQLTPYFHGVLSSSRKEMLNNFSALTGFVNSTNRNLRIDENHRFDGVFEVNRSLHLIGGVSQTVAQNTQFTVQDFDNKVLSVEGGMRYTLPSNASLTYRVRSGQGDFFKRPFPIPSNLLDTRFNDLEHRLQLIWPLTAKTSINGRIGHFSRKHEHFPQRDFSGLIGGVDVNWGITGKTFLMASFSHEIANLQTATNFQLPQFQRFSSSYVVTDRFSVMPIWQVSPHIILRVRYEYITRKFGGEVIPLIFGNRSDTHHTGMVMLSWDPIKTISLSAMVQKDHRSSNLATYLYDDFTASVTARLNF
ncbi:XrtB/PEP-CTERM-associated polysaccharide biosynthesis outer membrane protein EpsL [Nitrosovibrio sp. Nv17]|uniref:XrtB/PEP-CTERM-associated polysaccharide biosynthesis outer membrane protein EpsL n=1 Tax=Nitrosovibrio sp. Nv17 TaxID=1855339 RepID=UPI0009307592|nr:XrtB/PEP-CTERM-associated polysaccharide biosynthesis outer membrane protein EpsL [Nitrosovibrio sp. Nv17]